MEHTAHWLGGRVAVVTGASRGIGAAAAQAVAAAGAHVVLAARDRDALGRVAGRIRDAGGQATAVPTDVSSEAEVGRLFAEAERVARAVGAPRRIGAPRPIGSARWVRWSARPGC